MSGPVQPQLAIAHSPWRALHSSTDRLLSAAGSYRAALSAFSALDSPSALLTYYAARSNLALSPPNPQAALTLLSALPESLDTRALSALASYVQAVTEDDEAARAAAVDEMDELLADLGESGLEEDGEGRFVRLAMGTVYILEGEERRQDALDALREGVELGQDQEWSVSLSLLSLSSCNS